MITRRGGRRGGCDGARRAAAGSAGAGGGGLCSVAKVLADLRTSAVESFVVRTAVDQRTRLRLLMFIAQPLMLVEAVGGADRSSYTRAVAGSNPAAPTTLTSSEA